MLPRTNRLKSAQFDHAFAHSQSVRHPLVALKAHRRDDDSSEVRAAFVVPKKQDKAAGRNRTRRRLRERYRLHARRFDLTGCDLIFLTTPATHAATSGQLDEAIDEVTRRMKRKLGENGAAPSNRGDEQTQNVKESRRSAGLTPSSNLWDEAVLRLEEGVSPADSKRGVVFAPRLEEGASPAPEPQQNSTQVSFFARAALAVIRFYQRFISPGLPPACRFYPSCSRYTYGAIERFGLARGLWLGTYRVCRCHPWNAGGVDEVPAQFPKLHAVKERAVTRIKSVLTRRRFDSPRN